MLAYMQIEKTKTKQKTDTAVLTLCVKLDQNRCQYVFEVLLLFNEVLNCCIFGVVYPVRFCRTGVYTHGLATHKQWLGNVYFCVC